MECGSPSRCTTTRASKGSEHSQASNDESESAERRLEGWKVAQKVREKMFEVYRGAKPKRAVAVKEAETSSIYRRS